MRHTPPTAVSRVLRGLNEFATDLFSSTSIDSSYFPAVSCNLGLWSNLQYIQYGTFSSHLKAYLQIFEFLLDCYWPAIRLLPSKTEETTETKFLVRFLISWCLRKMRETAPFRNMLRLILICDLLGLIVGCNLTPKEILDAINGLGEQDDILDGRVYFYADILAAIVP